MMRGMVRSLRALLRDSLFPTRPALQPELPAIVRLETGIYSEGAVRLRAYWNERQGKIARDVPVRFRVLKGPLVLGPAGVTELVQRSDAKGFLAVGARMLERGQALLAADIGGVDPPAVFVLRTEGVVDSISVQADSPYRADGGVVRARAVALDHRKNPVDGADLYVELNAPDDHVVRGRAEERGGGIYDVVVETREARCWTLSVKDRATHAIGRQCITMLPGPPERIQ